MVLHLVDALHLEDTLYPVTKLNDMDINVVIAIRNYRQFLDTGHSLDIRQLSRMLGMPVVISNAEDLGTDTELIQTRGRVSAEPYERLVSVP